MRYEVRYENDTDRYSIIDVLAGMRVLETHATEKSARDRAEIENERWRRFVSEKRHRPLAEY